MLLEYDILIPQMSTKVRLLSTPLEVAPECLEEPLPNQDDDTSPNKRDTNNRYYDTGYDTLLF